MRVAVVKGALSALDGATCRHCPRLVRTGQTVLVSRLAVEYGPDLFVVHAECMRALVASIPAAPAPEMERASQKRLNRRLASRRAVAVLCDRHPDELLDLAEAELAVVALGG